MKLLQNSKLEDKELSENCTVRTSVKDGKKEKFVAGTGEWASQNANFINGCVHDCKYCYAKSMAIRFKRKTAQNWKIEEVNFNNLNRTLKKKNGYTMFPSSHDISPENLYYSIEFLQRLLENGHHVLVVSKPHLSVINAICKRFSGYRDKILFRFTIGSCNSETLKFWEPFAPSFEERFESLKLAHSLGFQTSISCEPVLDANTLELVKLLLPFITDAIWIGLPNRLKGIVKVNGEGDLLTLSRVVLLQSELSPKWVQVLYETLRNNPKIKWKESIKKIVNIERTTQKGLDL